MLLLYHTHKTLTKEWHERLPEECLLLFFRGMGSKCANTLPSSYPDNTHSVRLLFVAAECFEIGRHSYAGNDFYHAVMWMQEAYDRVIVENKGNASAAIVLDYLQYSLYKVPTLCDFYGKLFQVVLTIHRICISSFNKTWMLFMSGLLIILISSNQGGNNCNKV